MNDWNNRPKFTITEDRDKAGGTIAHISDLTSSLAIPQGDKRQLVDECSIK